MAFTQQSGRNAFYEDQDLTRAAPTTSTADGVSLLGLDAITVVVEANASQTLSGGGTLRGYLYDDYLGAWFRCAELDVTSITPSSVRRAAFNFVVSGARATSRVMWAADSVTVSSGTQVRVYLLCARKRGE